MSQTDNVVAEWLGNNPKMTGILFTMLLILSQAGTAVAHGSAIQGP